MKNNLNKGSTFIEVIFGISFLFLMILSIGVLIPDCLSRVKASGDDLIASDLGDRLMEQVRLLPFDKLIVGSYDGRVPTAQQSPGTADAFPPSPYPSVIKSSRVDGKLHQITYYFMVDCLPGFDREGNPAADLKQITVKVIWSRKTGGRMPVLKETIFYTLAGKR